MASLQNRIGAKLTGFEAKMKLAIQLSGKVFSEELNRRMLQLVVGAKGVSGLVQLTKKATEARIRSDMEKTVTYRTKGGKAHTGSLLRILAIQWLHNRGSHIDEGTISAAMQAILRARIQSRAYIAASWLWSAQALARKVPNNTLTRLRDNQIPMKDDGTAFNAFGKTVAASPNSLRATVYNTARGADVVAIRAVPRALGNATRDMGKYIARKYGEEYARRARGVTV